MNDAEGFDVDESIILTYAERLYESGHDEDSSVALAWATLEFMRDLGVINV